MTIQAVQIKAIQEQAINNPEMIKNDVNGQYIIKWDVKKTLNDIGCFWLLKEYKDKKIVISIDSNSLEVSKNDHNNFIQFKPLKIKNFVVIKDNQEKRLITIKNEKDWLVLNSGKIELYTDSEYRKLILYNSDLLKLFHALGVDHQHPSVRAFDLELAREREAAKLKDYAMNKDNKRDLWYDIEDGCLDNIELWEGLDKDTIIDKHFS